MISEKVKKTILVIKALNEAKEEERKLIISNLGNKNASRDELERVANIIKYYSLDYAYNLAEMYSKKAIESISRIKSRNQTAEKALKYLAEFTIKRRK